MPRHQKYFATLLAKTCVLILPMQGSSLSRLEVCELFCALLNNSARLIGLEIAGDTSARVMIVDLDKQCCSSDTTDEFHTSVSTAVAWSWGGSLIADTERSVSVLIVVSVPILGRLSLNRAGQGKIVLVDGSS